ncbi:neo-calmodulin-like [Ananas comosus]|uniref:Neo-calmodulin-like n=1 Tax=Ananas comosus TaxID=4615 RepID=A0A6P5EPF1_ANACO|nr:neo-calmodulin-like [Ananas comosus]
MFSPEKVGGFLQKFKAVSRRGRRASSNFKWISSAASPAAAAAAAAAELPNQLRRVFDLIDSNGDGKISAGELRDIMLRLGHERSTVAREAEGMVREADCDGDGFIDLDEFMRAVSERGAGVDEEEELREAFRVFDADRNGYISAEEVRRVLAGLGRRCSLKECRLMIRGVDRNGDGVVDFEEFKAMMMMNSLTAL